MNLFNIEGNDISPNKVVEFWVTCLLMFFGVLILGNLIGEFTNILNEIYESDFNNEIEEHSKMIESVLQTLEVPEDIEQRVDMVLDLNTVQTDFIWSKKFFEYISIYQR